jgi:hypothetical protein
VPRCPRARPSAPPKAGASLPEAARADNVEAALRLKAENPDLGGIVLECTNMCPYAADIRAATGLPVWSIVSLVEWFQSGLVPRRFAQA